VAGAGKPDLLVITVDNPGGQNRGALPPRSQPDAQGNVTPLVTPGSQFPIGSPGKSGLGAAIIDLDNDGHKT